MTDPCTEQHRLETIERELREVEATVKTHGSDINHLKKENAKTEVYVKMILEKGVRD